MSMSMSASFQPKKIKKIKSEDDYEDDMNDFEDYNDFNDNDQYIQDDYRNNIAPRKYK